MKKLLLTIMLCFPQIYAMETNKGTKRKHEDNATQQVVQNQNDVIAQLSTSHQSLSDALLCVTRPYNRQTDEEISKTAKLIVSRPGVDVHVADFTGQTSLIRTAIHNLPQTMLVLLRAGSRIEDLCNLQLSSQQHKISLTNALKQYKEEHDQNLAEAQSILARFLPVTQTHKNVSQLLLVKVISDYLEWPEDYSVTIPKTIQVTWQPTQSMLRRLSYSKGGGGGSRY